MARRRRLRLLLLLLGAGLLFSGSGCPQPAASSEGKCGAPKLVENARIAEGDNSTRLRYSCVKNYKRKVGTSNLSICKQDDQTKEFRWTEPNLICIRDPSLPTSGPEDSLTEAKTSTTAAPKTADASPPLGSTHPYGTTATSPPASGTASTPLETANPSPGGPAMAAGTTVGVNRGATPGTTPGIVTHSVTLPQRNTTLLWQARTSETLKAGHRSTAAPSEASIPWTLTGSPGFKIGFSFLGLVSFIGSGFLLWWCCYRRQRHFPRRPDLRLPEEIPMASMQPEEDLRTEPSASDPHDSGPSNERDPALSSSSTLSTG